MTAAEVPLVISKAGGIEKARELGAVDSIGSDESLAGVAGGRYFDAAGAEKVLCVDTLPGATDIEARCRGVARGIAEKGGSVSQLPLPSTAFRDPTAVAEAIEAAIPRDPAIAPPSIIRAAVGCVSRTGGWPAIRAPSPTGRCAARPAGSRPCPGSGRISGTCRCGSWARAIRHGRPCLVGSRATLFCASSSARTGALGPATGIGREIRPAERLVARRTTAPAGLLADPAVDLRGLFRDRPAGG